MEEWTNGSSCSEDAKRILQGYYLFIALLFSATIPRYSALFSVERIFCKDIYNSRQYVHFTFRWDIDGSSKT